MTHPNVPPSEDHANGLGRTWTHKLALIFVRPLANTFVTPNHLTFLRLITGLVACYCFATGDRELMIWGGWIWVLSAFLDRTDGELARVSGKTSAWGHKFDMFCDSATTSLFFVAGGIGLRDTELGHWAIFMGIAGGLGVLAAEYYAEQIDKRNDDPDDRAYPGFADFDFDDVLYLFAVIAWFDWFMPIVIGASIGAPAFALLTWYKWQKLPPLDNAKP
ncbi:CDP-alcohol phosphatidyltransferase family protein [Rhodospirillales bacterium]|jgi:archaetidylinositol phosphate synthase|nr:CDP-alcohol phosphatidyltransferase family protein [Rhodospirillales bacterium]